MEPSQLHRYDGVGIEVPFGVKRLEEAFGTRHSKIFASLCNFSWCCRSATQVTQNEGYHQSLVPPAPRQLIRRYSLLTPNVPGSPQIAIPATQEGHPPNDCSPRGCGCSIRITWHADKYMLNPS